MPIQGLRTSDNFATDERPKNWREGLLRSQPNGNLSLTGLTSMMKTESVDDPHFHWWEKQVETRRIALGANLTTSNTTITVGSGAKGLKKGDILRVEQTGEHLRVAADPTSDTSIQVSRAFGTASAQTVDYDGNNVNPNLVVVGSAFEEGSLAPTGVNFDPTKKYNYTQIFRSTLEATRTALKTRLRTTDQAKEAKRECLEIVGMDMERAFWFGQRNETTENGKPIRTTGGIMSFIDSDNVVDVNSAYASGLTMEGLEEYMYNMFKYGSSEKMAFCGNRALLTINQVVRKNTTYNIQFGVKEYGMNVTRLTSPFGELVLKTHPLFNQMTGGTTGTGPYYGAESWIFVLDMGQIKYKYLTDSDLAYQPKLEANGLDGMHSGYLAECGLEVANARHHYLMKNVVSAAADS